MNTDMGVMISEVIGDNVLTLEIGVNDIGETVYRFSWYNGRQWGARRFYSMDEAYSIYRLVRKMV